MTPYSKTYDDDQAGSVNQESCSTGNVKWDFRESRVRAYGGSTMHRGGWALRFKEEDFRCRTNTGFGADWPFSYDVLEPWLRIPTKPPGYNGIMPPGDS